MNGISIPLKIISTPEYNKNNEILSTQIYVKNQKRLIVAIYTLPFDWKIYCITELTKLLD